MTFIKTEQISPLANILSSLTDNLAQLDLATAKKQIDALTIIFKQLKQLEWPTQGEHFNYDTINAMTEVCEDITLLRIATPPIRHYLFENGFWALSIEILLQFKKALYQHEGLQNKSFEYYPMPTEKSEPALTIWAKAALQRAREASAAAEVATEEGAIMLKQMQKQLESSPSSIDSHLMTKTNQTIFIQNALAAITADEAAAALIEVEERLNANKK